MKHSDCRIGKMQLIGGLLGVLWPMAIGFAAPESPEPDPEYWLLIQRVAGQDLASADKELHRLLKSRESELEKALTYMVLLGAYHKARNAAVYKPDSMPSGRDLTERAYGILAEGLRELHEPKAVLFLSGSSLPVLCSPRDSQQVDETLSAEVACRLAKTACDACASACRRLEEPLQLSILAREYVRFGYPRDAQRVYEEVTRLPSTSPVRGQCLLKIAGAWDLLPVPDWERCLLTLDEALACTDLPAPHTLWARQEDLDRYCAEWTRKARDAPPKSRLAGYLTLWQRGLTERMGAYWTDALREQLKTEAQALGELSQRPIKVGEIATVEGQSDDGKPGLTVALEFAPESPNPTGQWVFRLVSAKATAPWPITWLIDRIEPPTPRP